LRISLRERGTRKRQNAKELAREAVGWSVLLGGGLPVLSNTRL